LWLVSFESIAPWVPAANARIEAAQARHRPRFPTCWNAGGGVGVQPIGMTTIGFIGSGRLGGAVARLAVAAGYDVCPSRSGTRAE
jgi:lactate dehydrogenase-like 2-hydroxyacid dehydrogenase